jgi:hypothetical protein
MRIGRDLPGGAQNPWSRTAFLVHLDGSPHVGVAEPQGSDPANVVQLDRRQYTEVR